MTDPTQILKEHLSKLGAKGGSKNTEKQNAQRRNALINARLARHGKKLKKKEIER